MPGQLITNPKCLFTTGPMIETSEEGANDLHGLLWNRGVLVQTAGNKAMSRRSLGTCRPKSAHYKANINWGEEIYVDMVGLFTRLEASN